MINILIIDESSYLIYIIEKLLSKYDDIKVIKSINNLQVQTETVFELNPDIIIVNMNIPHESGKELIRRLFSIRKIPFLLISSKIDIITVTHFSDDLLPYIDHFEIFDTTKILESRNAASDLCDKIRNLKTVSKTKKNVVIREVEKPQTIAKFVIAIGSSTGGPKTLKKIIPYFKPNLKAAVLISQHMPTGFTNMFAKQLDDISPFLVLEAKDKMKIYERTVYVCPGSHNMKVNNNKIILEKSDPDNLESPSVNIMFKSVAEEYKSNCIAIVLTGMGKDGSKGIVDIKNNNGFLIAQDKESSVIFGMPKAAIETGLVNKVLPDNLIPEFVNKKVSQMLSYY